MFMNLGVDAPGMHSIKCRPESGGITQLVLGKQPYPYGVVMRKMIRAI